MTGRICLLLAAALPAWAVDPIRVQITTGGHAHSPSFYRVFEGQPDLALTVNPHPSAYRRDLRKFVDVLVLYDLADTTAERERKNLRDYLDSGRGAVVIHHAIASNWQWPWWYEEVLGARYFLTQEGASPRSIPKENQRFTVRVVAKHPVTTGVDTMTVTDETYKGMLFSPKVKVLMETDHPDNDRPVVWIGPYEKARVVYIMLGHGESVHNDPTYRRLVRNAVLWAARRLP